MTEKNYKGFGSRMVFDTQNIFGNFEEEDIFGPNAISDRPELRVDLRYFTVELRPNLSHQQKLEEKQETSGRNNKNTLSNSEETKELSPKASPTDTVSCESFHSCLSSVSIQGLLKDNTEVGRKSSSSSHLGSRKNAKIRDEELLNQLTMVNAIFLSNNVTECIHSEKTKKTQEKNGLHAEHLKTLKSPTASSFCSEAFTCQIDRNPGVNYINTIFKDNITTKSIINNQSFKYDLLEDDHTELQKRWSAKINLSKPYVPDSPMNFNTISGMGLKSHRYNDNTEKLVEEPPSKFVFQKTKHENIKPAMYKKVEIKIPKMEFAKLVPICVESRSPVLLQKVYHKTKTEQRKQEVNHGYEVKFFESNQLRNCCTLVAPESKENCSSNIGDIFCGNPTNKEVPLTNSLKLMSELFMKNVSEPYLRTLIKQSIKQIHNDKSEKNGNFNGLTSCKNSPVNCTLRDSDEENDILSINKDGTGECKIDFRLLNPALKQDCLKKTLSDIEPELYNTTNTDNKNMSDRTKQNFKDTSSLISFRNDKENECSENECSLVTETERCCLKRRSSDRHNLLPVIVEESSESLHSDRSEDNLADDYCLIDSNGRPIHLFDCQGLPLTDGCGRPLRTAHGKLLMKCDNNGIPVVDDVKSSIFDMFGRQPNEDKFDPANSPKSPVCNKLSTSDGKPLLLYSVEGRPLTSISGTMLVDSSGRGLVRLINSLEDSL